jgi:hypothetical protein
MGCIIDTILYGHSELGEKWELAALIYRICATVWLAIYALNAGKHSLLVKTFPVYMRQYICAY